ASDQSEPPYQQHQHDQSVEQSCGLKVDMQVRNDTREDENRSRDRKHPSDSASPVPEQHAHADQQGDERNPKSIGAVEAPVGTNHDDLSANQVSSSAGHGDPHQEMAEAARRSSHIAQTTLCH